MTTTLESPVATLKAEIVTDFEFTPDYYTSRFRSEDRKISNPYRSDFDAKVGVKVGNSVKELRFHVASKYMSSFTDANGNYHSGNHIEYCTLAADNAFSELEKVGILVDYLDVLIKYQEALEVARQKRTAYERLKNWNQIRGLKKAHTNAWIHSVSHTLSIDPNKKIKAALLSTTIEACSVETFLKSQTLSVDVNYKGINTNFYMNDGAFAFDGDSTYKFPKDYNGEISYTHKFKIAEGRNRRAKRLGTLYLKFVEEVDLELARIESKKNNLNKEAQKRNEQKEKLSKVTGYPIVILKETKYTNYGRGRSESYVYYTYAIITKQPESSYSSPEYIEIHENRDETYKVAGLKNLTAEQMKGVLNIVLEGKEVFSSLVVPK